MYAAISRCEDARAVPGAAGDADLERADGEARVAVERRGDRPRLAGLYQRAPCRVLFPRIDGRECGEAVFVNTAGGVAGGDRLRHAVSVGPGASIVATTQAAEKIYGAIDRPARIETALAADGDGRLDWLPQETILFDGARLKRTMEIEAADGASVLALEWLVLGRRARGERLHTGDIRDAWRVRRGGRLVWADAFRLDGELGPPIARPALLAGRAAVATLVYVAPDAPAALDGVRARLAGSACLGGATAVGGLLVARLLAHDPAALREAAIRLLGAFPGAGGASSVPRAWSC